MFDSETQPISEIVKILSEFDEEEMREAITYLRMIRAREVSRRLTDAALRFIVALAPVIKFFQGVRHV